ncbi:hypothetical protein JNUCC1_02515 [Lentibacillus sp. JNUCC-1]|uniref:hypothetical protein n=1 Tax=Lentibacillus sp. JNUCC-1 TaxID=2654513 RepID=UPI0012E767AD|nr:hypothetical protein [Lentibacillus sp. JNUCC-1]MUV38661.1 hypothetical protein [Lentibacillus sp. JNUCC-1]
MDNTKAIITILEDKNGNQQLFDVVAKLSADAKRDTNAAELAHLVAQAFDYLEYVGVPPKHERLFTGENLSGDPITIANVVKELNHAPPLLELRANRRGYGAFRALFFYEDINDKHHIYFTKAIIKKENNPPEFNQIVNESLKMLEGFLND